MQVIDNKNRRGSGHGTAARKNNMLSFVYI